MRFEFQIGAGFPSGEIVAQFVTVAAMISNDWLRLASNAEKLEGPDQVGHELLNYRLQAALHYEATNFLRDAAQRTEVADFITELPAPARKAFEVVLAGLDEDPEIGHGDWFKRNRNRTFHYSVLGHRSPVAQALERASPEKGIVNWDRTVGKTRFPFADQVFLEWLPAVHEQDDRLTRMSESVAALSQFTDIAIGHYLISRGLTEVVDYNGE